MTGNRVLDIFVAAGILAGGLTLAVMLGRAVRTIARLIAGVDEFLDDWRGTPERPGVEARPGVMARLADQDQRLETIEHEVVYNDGTSLKDAVRRIGQELGTEPEH